MVGCSQPGDGAPRSTQNTATGTPSSREAGGETPIRIDIDGATITGVVWHNPTGLDLLDRLPVTVQFHDHNRQEKTGPLRGPLTMDGMPKGDTPHTGDLGYFAPSTDLVLYYAEAPYWTGIARIGHLDGDLSAIASAAAGFTATVERADP
jgi:hypothetical protein